MDEGLGFGRVFGGLPRVEFPFDQSLPVDGWLVSRDKAQVTFWYAKTSYESKKPSHPYAEWGTMITGWCDITTSDGCGRCYAGDVFPLAGGVPHASVTSDGYRSMDVFFSSSHFPPEAGGGE